MTKSARSYGGRYPAVIGITALMVSAVLYSYSKGDLRGERAARGDDSLGEHPRDGSAKGDPTASLPKLVWRVEGVEKLPRPSGFGRCLSAQGQGRSLVLANEERPREMAVSHPDLPESVRIGPAEEGSATLTLVTTVGEDRRAAMSLHLAAAGCLHSAASGLTDPHLGRRYTKETWPTFRETGGIPVEVFFAIDKIAPGGRLVTRGLDRLGLPELELTAADDGAARRTLQLAAVAVIVGGLGDGPFTVTDGVQAKLGPVADGRRPLMDQDGQGVLLARAATPGPQPRRSTNEGPPKPEPPPTTPAIKPGDPQRRQPATPARPDETRRFMPDYR